MNLWNAVKRELRGKFIAENTYFEKEEGYKINSLLLHLKGTRKEEIWAKS